MESERWKMENGKPLKSAKKLSTVNYLLPNKNSCPACGTELERECANYCRICGKPLSEDYQPLDSLRASNRLHGKAIVYEKRTLIKNEGLFNLTENGMSETAKACLVYSLVPYIGIIFIPLTVTLGTLSLLIYFQKPWLGGRNISLASLSLSLVVLAVQIFLWWLLYIIPTIGRSF